MHQERLATCRACGGTELTEAFALPGEDPWVFCGDGTGAGGCGLLQRAVAGEEDGRMTPVMPLSWTEQHRLRAAAGQALEMMTTRDGNALDIGCGEGSLLSAYPRWVAPVGMDARLGDSGPKDWGYGLAAAFDSHEGQRALDAAGYDRFDLVTAFGVLEESEDPLAFLMRAAGRLTRDGVLVVETPYAALALTRTMASAFHDKARAVYMLSVLQRLASAAGLKIVRGAMSETAGGSIRLFMTHADYTGHDYAPWTDALARLWDEEAALALHGPQPYRAFAARQRDRRAEGEALAERMEARFEHAYVLDGSDRMQAALRASGLNGDHVTAVVAGPGFTLGGVEVDEITAEEARRAGPDMLIAPAWRRRETLEQWHDFVAAGGRLVFLEPELQIVDAACYPAELGRALALTDGPGSVASLRAALSAMRRPALSVIGERRA